MNVSNTCSDLSYNSFLLNNYIEENIFVHLEFIIILTT